MQMCDMGGKNLVDGIKPIDIDPRWTVTTVVGDRPILLVRGTSPRTVKGGGGIRMAILVIINSNNGRVQWTQRCF